MTFQEILDRAVQHATGVAGESLPQVDREITAETVFPHAVRAVYREQARTGRHLENITAAYPIRITNGEGSLPDGVIREFVDRSYLPRVRFASLVPFEDFPRSRFDNQLSYYAIRGDKLFYSGELPGEIGTTEAAALIGNVSIVGDASQAKVGDRFALTDDENGLIIDAYIETITGNASFTLRGKALDSTSDAMTGTFYNGQDDVEDRSVTDLVTDDTSQTVSSATADFTSDDVGKRLRAYETGTETVVVDAVIDSVTSVTEAVLRAKPLSTHAACDADILYSPLLLQTPGIPDLSADACADLEFTQEVAEDVIVKIAAVLRGEVGLQSLIELGNGRGRR